MTGLYYLFQTCPVVSPREWWQCILLRLRGTGRGGISEVDHTFVGNGNGQGSKVRILGRKGTLGVIQPREVNSFYFWCLLQLID